MANRKKWLGMSLMILVFGMIVVGFNGCSNADPRLNGTWKGEYGIEKNDSGMWEDSDPDGTPVAQGTYTTSGGKVTSKPTHYFGNEFGLDSRWYSMRELKKELGKDFDPDYFNITTSEYNVDDNKITYIFDDGDTYIVTLVSRDGKFEKASNIINKK